MSDRITPDSFFSDTHAFVAPQPVVRFFFFSSSSRRLTTKCILLYIYAFRTRWCTSSSSRVPQRERVFRPLLVTQLFPLRWGEKEKKCLSLLFRDAFLISKFIREVLTCLLYNTHTLSRSDYYYYDFNR